MRPRSLEDAASMSKDDDMAADGILGPHTCG